MGVTNESKLSANVLLVQGTCAILGVPVLKVWVLGEPSRGPYLVNKPLRHSTNHHAQKENQFLVGGIPTPLKTMKLG